MSFVLGLVLGGVCFSLLLSVCVLAKQATEPKTPYEEWLAEVQKMNIVHDKKSL